MDEKDGATSQQILPMTEKFPARRRFSGGDRGLGNDGKK